MRSIRQTRLSLVFLVLTSCSTVALPVIRNETGETLGANQKQISATIMTGRAIPIIPSSLESAFATSQTTSSPFSSLVGTASFKYGFLVNLDIRFDTVLLLTGGGWRGTVKYQLLGTPQSSNAAGNFAVSGMLSHGRYASQGSVTYDTASSSSSTSTSSSSGSASYTQRLSTASTDISVPISYRFSDSFAVYSGLHSFISSSEGTLDTSSLEASNFDLGINLGLQIKIDTIRLDLESMMLKVDSPFSGSSEFTLLFGAGGSIVF